MKIKFKGKSEKPAETWRRELSLLSLVILHEWRRMNRDKTIWSAILLLTGLILYATVNGGTWVGFQRETIAKALIEESHRLDSLQTELSSIEQGKSKPRMFRDPGRPGWVGEFLGTRYATIPPTDLAALSIGQRDLNPFYFRVSTLSADSFINEDEIENPLNLLTGRFDVAFVIILLFPLVIFAASYDLLSSEKESGTLSLALSQPLGLIGLAVSKLLARFVPLVVLVVILSVAGAMIADAQLNSTETILRLLLWSFAVTLYALFWFAVALLINSFGKSSATNAVTLAAAWLGLTIIVPAFLTLVVSWINPVDSRLGFITAMRDARRDTAERTGEILTEFYRTHPHFQPAEPDKNDYMPGFYAAQIERDKKFLPMLRDYEGQLARQSDLAERLRILSPSLAAQFVFNDLAATGHRRSGRFVDQVHEFHREWQQFFLPKLFRHERLTARDYQNFPTFRFKDEPFRDVTGRALPAMAGILVPTLLIGWRSLRRLGRFPIT